MNQNPSLSVEVHLPKVIFHHLVALIPKRNHDSIPAHYQSSSYQKKKHGISTKDNPSSHASTRKNMISDTGEIIKDYRYYKEKYEHYLG